jgi:rhodanese-related sulfurtransferase
VAVKELMADLTAGRALALVDVREGNAYAGVHIPSALNIPLHSFVQCENEVVPTARQGGHY